MNKNFFILALGLLLCIASCKKLNQFRRSEFFNVDFLSINPYEERAAICILRSFTGDNLVYGTVIFRQENMWATTNITANFTGLEPNTKHGFHIYEFGDLSNGCMSAGEHYNPEGTSHGGPTDRVRHAGDFGNIETDEFGRNNTFNLESEKIKLAGRNSVVGRTCVVHLRTDDLGRGSSLESFSTGSSGERLACGIIGILDPKLHQ